MNIYLISRKDHIGYDECEAFVIAAKSPTEVRALIIESQLYGDERSYPWTTARVKLVGTTDKYKRPTVILSSFLAG